MFGVRVMSSPEQLSRIVQLSEQLHEAALDLDLDFIAFLAEMVVIESRRSYYWSLEDEAPEGATQTVNGANQLGVVGNPKAGRRHSRRKQPIIESSNVTQLFPRRSVAR
jgi:hypothetical protein